MAEVLAEFDTAHCGPVRDAQIDTYGERLATASADGRVRIWEIAEGAPTLLAELGGHIGPVQQVAWSTPDVGNLLASVGNDGCLLIWGPEAERKHWRVVRREQLGRHGAARSVAWAPGEHGPVIACACADGWVVVVAYTGESIASDGEITHHWQSLPFQAHQGSASSVSWASPPVVSERPLGLDGARLATAGDDGLRVWQWSAASSRWEAEVANGKASNDPARDVAWKPWDGVAETVAVAVGTTVRFWVCEQQGPNRKAQWRPAETVDVGEEVWRVSWTEIGGVLLASCGVDAPQALLLKQQLSGEWDIMDLTELEDPKN